MFVKLNIVNRSCIAFILNLLLGGVFIINGQPNVKKDLLINTIYAKEFRNVKKSSYNKQLIESSVYQPEKNWRNYQGPPITTSDSTFRFGTKLISKAFPTNSSIVSNSYLIYYYSLKESICPTLFSLLKYYQPTIKKNLEYHNLPKELMLLPVVCSAMNPFSLNDLGGTGYWHLTYPQAIRYGITVDKYIDERKDFIKSTEAATHYIKDLYDKYGNWELTLAAYSCGIVTVNKLLNRSNEKTYEAIFPHLPESTRDLVQAFVAMNYIYQYDTYGTVLLNPKLNIDTIYINRKLSYQALQDVCQTNNEELSLLNPTIINDIFPKGHVVSFTKETKEKFLSLKDSIYFHQDSVLFNPNKNKTPLSNHTPFNYEVQSGDVLGSIAEQFRVTVKQLKEWNDLKNSTIHIGQQLVLFKKISSETNKEASKEVQKIDPSQPFFMHKVKSGENLWLVAKKYPGISAQNIMDFNGIGQNLKVGQVLKIPKK